MISVKSPSGVVAYRNDPYALELLPTHTCSYDNNPVIFYSPKWNANHTPPCDYYDCAASPEAPSPLWPAASPIDMEDSSPDCGSPSSTEGKRKRKQRDREPMRFAYVSFKFGSALFVAPFRVAVGDRVVAEGDGHTELLGVVADVTTQKPPMRVNHRLLRHARTKDHKAHTQCVMGEAPALKAAQAVVDERMISATLVDAEWQLDKTSLTVVVSFAGDYDEVDAIHRVLVELFVCRVFIITCNTPADSTCDSNSFLEHLSISSSRSSPPPEPLLC